MSFPKALGETAGGRILYVGSDAKKRGVEGAMAPKRVTVDHVRTDRLVGACDDADCVVADHRPPEVNGLDALRSVRRHAPDLPFVLAPSEGSETLAADAVAAGVSEYVPPGTDASDRLASAVDRAVVAERERDRLSEARRVAALIQDVTRAIVGAETRDELERTVCDRLGESAQYRFVWSARYGDEGGLHSPVVAGDDEFTVTSDERTTGDGPPGEAIRTGDLQTTRDVREDAGFGSWREAALERGVLAAAAVPVVYEDTTYGVLSLYADRPWGFDDAERELLRNLGDAMAHGIHLLETRNELQTFRKAVEHAGHTIYITRPDGTIEYVNPRFEEVTGYDAAEAVGRTPSILKSGEHDAAFYRRLWSTILSDDVWTSEIVNRRKDGTTYHVNQTIAPITDEEGNIDRFVAVNDDVTAEKRQQRTLERRNERLNRFTSIVSHDLRNPLNVAQGELQRAKAGEPDRLDVVETALDRMAGLVEDLLHLSRQGDAIDDPSPVALAGVVRRAWETTDTGDATLDVDVDGVTVVADADRLVQVFANLFRNAVEHGSTGGHTPDASAERAGPTITVGVEDGAMFVADDGPGIPADERTDVFDHAYTTHEAGTGLGLAIVDTIAGAHGWEVGATESEAGGARIELRDVEFG